MEISLPHEFHNPCAQAIGPLLDSVVFQDLQSPVLLDRRLHYFPRAGMRHLIISRTYERAQG
jgi:hypothetical protein